MNANMPTILRCLNGSLLALWLLCVAEPAVPTANAGIFSDHDAACDPWYRFHRAGNPHCIAPWARTTYGPDYCGYYVGGGSPWRGDERCPHEGTWGVDYAPWWSRVRLNWWHGQRFQGGAGQYEPDGHNRPFKNGKE